MALAPCRECGREISTEAAACPHCGAPAAAAAGQTDRKVAAWGFAALMAVFLVIVTLAGGSSKEDEPSMPASVKLEVAAVPERSVLQVANGPNEPLTDCEIALNHGFSGAFELRIGNLAPNARRVIPLSEFTAGGKRFDPQTMAVQMLVIDCMSPRGRGYWGWQKR